MTDRRIEEIGSTVQYTDYTARLGTESNAMRARVRLNDDPLWLAYSVSPRPHWDWEIIVCGAALVVVLVSAFGALYFSEEKRREREAACEQRGGIPVYISRGAHLLCVAPESLR